MCHKAPYLTRREAQAAARRFKRHSNQQRPYLCHACKMWHLWTQQARGKRAQYRQDKRKETMQ